MVTFAIIGILDGVDQYFVVFLQQRAAYPAVRQWYGEMVMRAIVIKQYGGPEQLVIEERPVPVAKAGEVLIEVKAFGLNHAEIYMRQGAWGKVAEITGIECAGIVRSDPAGRLTPGQKVVAIVGGMGRSRNGSYAELVSAPAANVAPVETMLSWEQLAAVPESYATAWTALNGILEMAA